MNILTVLFAFVAPTLITVTFVLAAVSSWLVITEWRRIGPDERVIGILVSAFFAAGNALVSAAWLSLFR